VCVLSKGATVKTEGQKSNSYKAVLKECVCLLRGMSTRLSYQVRDPFSALW
jgi:hypothetical protein